MKHYAMIMLLSAQIAQSSAYDNSYALPFPRVPESKITQLRQELRARTRIVDTAYESLRSTFQAYQQLCTTYKIITSKIRRNDETFNWIEYIRNNPELLLTEQHLKLAYEQALYLSYKDLYKQTQVLLVPLAETIGYHDAVLCARHPETTPGETQTPRYLPVPLPQVPTTLRRQDNVAPK